MKGVVMGFFFNSSVFFLYFSKSVFSPSIEGSYNGWVEDHKTSGPPFVCNVSLIETACHLCGDVKAVGGTYSENEDSFHATAHLETPDKRCEPFYK